MHAGASGGYAGLVHAKNERAVAFYRRYGFYAFASHPRTPSFTMATAKKILLG